jgi:hypothetical protein
VVKVPEVKEFAKTLPGVVFAEETLYACSQDNQEQLKKAGLQTIPSWEFTTFDDATKWRLIADHNHITNPLALEPGTYLRIPVV